MTATWIHRTDLSVKPAARAGHVACATPGGLLHAPDCDGVMVGGTTDTEPGGSSTRALADNFWLWQGDAWVDSTIAVPQMKNDGRDGPVLGFVLGFAFFDPVRKIVVCGLGVTGLPFNVFDQTENQIWTVVEFDGATATAYANAFPASTVTGTNGGGNSSSPAFWSPKRGRGVLLPGASAGGGNNAHWEYDATAHAFTFVADANDRGATSYTGGWDAAMGQSYAAGGDPFAVISTDVGAGDVVTIDQVGGAPAECAGHAGEYLLLVYDAIRGKMILKGPQHTFVLTPQVDGGNDVHHASAWVQLAVTDEGPTVTQHPYWAGFYDYRHRKIVLFGGVTDGSGRAVSQETYTLASPPVVSIAVTQGNQLLVGGTAQLTALATLDDTSTIDVTLSASWSTSDVRVATVSSIGLASAVSNGDVTFTATVGSISGELSAVITTPVAVTIHLNGGSDSVAPIEPITGYDFIAAPVGQSLRVKWPTDLSFVDADPHLISEIGYGDYELLKDPDLTVGGVVYTCIKTPTNQTWRSFEFVTNPLYPLMTELPVLIESEGDRLDGDTTGITWSLGQWRIKFSGGAYFDAPLDQVVERGENWYAFVPTDEQRVANAGKKIYYHVVANPGVWIEATGFYDMTLNQGVMPTPTPPTPIPPLPPVPVPPVAGARDMVAGALSRLVRQFREDLPT